MNLHFEPVTPENRGQLEALSLLPNQAGYIESVEECLAEADTDNTWEAVGIYDGPDLVGFSMYGYFPQPLPDGRVWLDRLLIDKSYQGKGYGKTAVTMLLDILADKYRQKNIYLSVYDINKPAIRLYEKAGFRFNGELDTKGEKIMVCEVL